MEFYKLKLKKINIKNFRCFKEVECNLEDSLTTLIGQNSVGKSTMMEALIKLLSKNPVDRVFQKNDFFNLENRDENSSVKCSIEILLEIPNPNVLYEDYPIYTYYRDGKAYIRARLDAILHNWGIISGVNYLDENDGIIYFDIEGNQIDEEKLFGVELDRDGTLLRRILEIFYIPARRDSIKEILFEEGTLLYEILKHSHKNPREESSFTEEASKLNKQLINSDRKSVV